MSNSGGNKNESSQGRNKVRSQALLLSGSFMIFGALIVVLLIVIGLTMISYGLKPEKSNPDAEVSFESERIDIEYEAQDFYYSLDDAFIEKGNSFIVSKIGSEGLSAVIKNQERYNELVRYLEQYGADITDYSLDEGYFRTGSIVAIALEGDNSYELAEQTVTSVKRDEHYDVYLTINGNTGMPEGKNSRITLVKLPKNTPQTTYLDIK